MSEPAYYQLRAAFEADMRAAGWRPLTSVHGAVYAWTCNHDERRVIDDKTAFNYWKATFSTPAQVLPASVEKVLGGDIELDPGE
jgi:hypothetical protein